MLNDILKIIYICNISSCNVRTKTKEIERVTECESVKGNAEVSYPRGCFKFQDVQEQPLSLLMLTLPKY